MTSGAVAKMLQTNGRYKAHIIRPVRSQDSRKRVRVSLGDTSGMTHTSFDGAKVHVPEEEMDAFLSAYVMDINTGESRHYLNEVVGVSDTSTVHPYFELDIPVNCSSVELFDLEKSNFVSELTLVIGDTILRMMPTIRSKGLEVIWQLPHGEGGDKTGAHIIVPSATLTLAEMRYLCEVIVARLDTVCPIAQFDTIACEKWTDIFDVNPYRAKAGMRLPFSYKAKPCSEEGDCMALQCPVCNLRAFVHKDRYYAPDIKCRVVYDAPVSSIEAAMFQSISGMHKKQYFCHLVDVGPIDKSAGFTLELMRSCRVAAPTSASQMDVTSVHVMVSTSSETLSATNKEEYHKLTHRARTKTEVAPVVVMGTDYARAVTHIIGKNNILVTRPFFDHPSYPYGALCGQSGQADEFKAIYYTTSSNRDTSQVSQQLMNDLSALSSARVVPESKLSSAPFTDDLSGYANVRIGQVVRFLRVNVVRHGIRERRYVRSVKGQIGQSYQKNQSVVSYSAFKGRSVLEIYFQAVDPGDNCVICPERYCPLIPGGMSKFHRTGTVDWAMIIPWHSHANESDPEVCYYEVLQFWNVLSEQVHAEVDQSPHVLFADCKHHKCRKSSPTRPTINLSTEMLYCLVRPIIIDYLQTNGHFDEVQKRWIYGRKVDTTTTPDDLMALLASTTSADDDLFAGLV